LHEQAHGTNAFPVSKQVLQDGRGNVIGQVPKDPTRGGPLLAAHFGKIHSQHVRLKYHNMRYPSVFLLEAPCERGINLDSHYLASTFSQKAGHSSSAGSDLDHQGIRRKAEFVENFLSVVRVLKEMLAEFGTLAMDFGSRTLDFVLTPNSMRCIIARAQSS
jgi:hypothetical protein